MCFPLVPPWDRQLLMFSAALLGLCRDEVYKSTALCWGIYQAAPGHRKAVGLLEQLTGTAECLFAVPCLYNGDNGKL